MWKGSGELGGGQYCSCRTPQFIRLTKLNLFTAPPLVSVNVSPFLLSVWPVLQSTVQGACSEICPIRRISEIIMEGGLYNTPPHHHPPPQHPLAYSFPFRPFDSFSCLHHFYPLNFSPLIILYHDHSQRSSFSFSPVTPFMNIRPYFFHVCPWISGLSSFWQPLLVFLCAYCKSSSPSSSPVSVMFYLSLASWCITYFAPCQVFSLPNGVFSRAKWIWTKNMC